MCATAQGKYDSAPLTQPGSFYMDPPLVALLDCNLRVYMLPHAAMHAQTGELKLQSCSLQTLGLQSLLRCNERLSTGAAHMKRVIICISPHTWEPVHASHTRAVKSADPVAHRRAGGLSTQDHTAPLWPTKVPYLNRAQCKSGRLA